MPGEADEAARGNVDGGWEFVAATVGVSVCVSAVLGICEALTELSPKAEKEVDRLWPDVIAGALPKVEASVVASAEGLDEGEGSITGDEVLMSSEVEAMEEVL